MAPTKTGYVSLIEDAEQVYLAMIDELPARVWIEMHDKVMKRLCWAYELQQCTIFEVVE